MIGTKKERKALKAKEVLNRFEEIGIVSRIFLATCQDNKDEVTFRQTL